MHRCVRTIAVGLALAAAPSVGHAQAATVPSTLSLGEALALAEQYSPTYRQTANDRHPASWGVRNAYASFLPSLSISGTATYRGAGTQRFLTTEFRQPSATIGSGYSVNLNWVFNGNTLLQPGVQKSQLAAADAFVDAARFNLRSVVVRQYVAVLEAEAQVTLQTRQVARNEENLRLSQARLNVGAATVLDVRQAEVAKGQSDVALLQAEQAVLVEKLRLFQQIGLPASDDPTTVTLSDSFPVIEPTWTLDELLIDAEASNPNIAALRSQETSFKWSERSVKSQWLPTVSVFAGWSGFTQDFTDGSFQLPLERQRSSNNVAACEIQNAIHADINSRGNTLPIADCQTLFALTPDDEAQILAGNSTFPFSFQNNPFVAQLQISLPIFDQFNRNLQVSRASVLAEDAVELRRAQELQVRTDVSQQFYALRAAYETIQIQTANRVAAGEAMRLARERYRVGSGTFFELLDAQVNAEQAESDYIRAQFDYHRALVDLEATVGRNLR